LIDFFNEIYFMCIYIPPFRKKFARRTGICLNMIVKNEARVIERLLRSVLPVIDYFVIVDTGSSDKTIEKITDFALAHSLGGEIHQCEWVNFGHNRQQALELALEADKGDWLLIIDADEEFAVDDPARFEQLQPGVTYQIEKHHGELCYALTNLIDVRRSRWQWRAPVHEYLACLAGGEHRQKLDGARIIYHAGEGARSHGVTQQEKFLRDAAVLEAALADDPNDARNTFYLAQSWRDALEPQKAYDTYAKRVQMAGWPEETYVAQCEKAALSITLQHDYASIVAEHLSAWRMRPSRAEALWQLARYCREQKKYADGYLFTNTGKDLPLPNDILFVKKSVYEWQLLDEFTVCAYWVGQYQASVDAARKLLAERKYPPEHQARIEANLTHAERKLNQGRVSGPIA
jgi:hypothetical protein